MTGTLLAIFYMLTLVGLWLTSEVRIYRTGGDVYEFVKKLDRFLKKISR